MEKYRISEKTLALIPITNKKTKIYESDNVIVINKSAKNIVSENCVLYGSSYQGRKQNTEDLIGVSYKSPILIEDSNKIILFPTCSPRLHKCSWISLNNLDSFSPYNDEGQLFFKNNLSLHVDVSSNILENQVLRASRLDSVLKNNNSKK